MDFDAIYNKYRIYATETWRILTPPAPRSNEQVKQEYETPRATTISPTKDHKDCYMTPGGLRMLSDLEYRDHLKLFFWEYFNKFDFRSVLEIGCGAGRNLQLIQEMYPLVSLSGLDVSNQCIKESREAIPNIDFYCYSAEKIPLDDNSIDIVLSVHALEQMNNILPRAIREICRVSRHGLLLFEPYYDFQNWFGRMHNKRLFYPRNIPDLIREQGFEITVYRDLCFGNPANRTGVLIASSKRNKQ
jgi:SAM-dependent methyltransferase